VVVDGEPAGAEVHFSSLEPLTPEFGDPNELPEIGSADMLAAGAPVNLLPHTVFDGPITLFIPINEDVDINNVGLAYYDGTQWLPAADPDGKVLPGGEGWMMPGSRIDHPESSPPLIEFQVYHFSAAQAVLMDGSGSATRDDRSHHSSGSNANVHISCFINSVNTGQAFELVELILTLLLIGFFLGLQRFRVIKTRAESLAHFLLDK
jgi:hypothetical protein